MTYKSFLFLGAMLVAAFSFLEAAPKYPASITFLVADLKFSKEHGVKICEIQNGSHSTFIGDAYLSGAPGPIAINFCNALSEFPMKKWGISRHIAHKHIQSLLYEDPNWKLEPLLRFILATPEFQELSKNQPDDLTNIFSYQGLLFIWPSHIQDYDEFQKMYPGIIVMDAETLPYWIDKYKMSQLFERTPELSALKPEWKLYYKKDIESLAKTVMGDIKSEYYVIKPRGTFLGNGVIIVAREELDPTFRTIFAKDSPLLRSSDKSYNYWKKDPYDSFIVEKFYSSDLIEVPELGNKVYDPTIRSAFILSHSNDKIDIKILGSYGLLPNCSIDEDCSLNDRFKAYCKPPLFFKLNDTIQKQVEEQLTKLMPLFYQEMIDND